MVTIVPIRAHQFNNKGITELFMIRAFLKGHTLSGPIVKISGRYSIDMNLADDLLGFDFAGRIYGKGNMRNISSRYYAVRDSGIYLNLIEESIREVFAFAGRLNGRTSLARLLKSSFNYKSDRYPYHDPPRGIEFAMSDAISNLHLKARWLPKIGCSGYVAGCNGLFINE
jgi:hypothetical protein